MPERLFRVDLHSHSSYSGDAWTSPRELVERAAAAGLDRIAITDHGTIDGAVAARRWDATRVIVGEEVDTREGIHVIGLFLTEAIPHGLPLRDVAGRIRAQGGVVYAPHPYAYPWSAARRAAAVLDVADVAEAFNSRAFWPRWNRRAAREAGRRGLRTGAGSDAHFPWEVGRAYTEMPPFTTPEEFLAAAATARAVGVRLGSPWLHVASLSLMSGRWLGRLEFSRGLRERPMGHGRRERQEASAS